MRTFHLKVFGLRNVQQIVPVCDLECVFLTFLIDESHLAPVRYARQWAQVSWTLKSIEETHSSPGFGGVRWPCIANGDVENLRRGVGNTL